MAEKKAEETTIKTSKPISQPEDINPEYPETLQENPAAGGAEIKQENENIDIPLRTKKRKTQSNPRQSNSQTCKSNQTSKKTTNKKTQPQDQQSSDTQPETKTQKSNNKADISNGENQQSSSEGKENQDIGKEKTEGKEKNHSVGDGAAPTKRRTGTTAGKAKIQYEDKLQILQDFEAGVLAQDIADKYGIAKSYIYRIINDPQIKELREKNKQAKTNNILQLLRDNNKTIEDITKRYLKLAMDEQRIEKSSLASLFTVWGIIVDKQLKMEEMELRREEIRLRREELSKGGASNNNGLLSEFLEVVKAKNTLPAREQKTKK